MIPESELIINPDGSIYHLNLKPEHLASTVIAVGDPERVPMVSRYFDEVEFKGSKREFVTHTGVYRGKRISVISTGMGTDNVEIFMNELDALVNVDLQNREIKQDHTVLTIVRVGTSGSMQQHIAAGSLLASEMAIGLDSLMHFYSMAYSDDEKRYAQSVQQQLGLPYSPYCVGGSVSLLKRLAVGKVIRGNTVTCPGFFGPQGRKIRLDPAIPNMIEQLATISMDGMRLTNFEMETAGYYAMGRLLGHEVLSLNAIVANRVDNTFAKDPAKVVDQLILHALENL